MSERDTQETLSPQQRVKCACPSYTGRGECMRIRYGIERGSEDDFGETCECCCHDQDEADDDNL
jgi:hypothetical protein